MEFWRMKFFDTFLAEHLRQMGLVHILGPTAIAENSTFLNAIIPEMTCSVTVPAKIDLSRLAYCLNAIKRGVFLTILFFYFSDISTRW